MTTWHQRQNPVPLWHETLWTVVFDAPNKMASVERFKDPVEAQRTSDRHNAAGQNSYVLPPFKATDK